MQGVGPVVDGQGVLLPVEGEFSLGDPVGNPADRRPEVRVLAEVAFKAVETENDVSLLAVAVRRVDLGNDGSVGHDLDRDLTVLQHVKFDRRAVRGLSEYHLAQAP